MVEYINKDYMKRSYGDDEKDRKMGGNNGL